MNQKIHLLIVALITVMLFSIPVFSSCESDNLQGVGVDVVAPTHVVSGEEFVFEVRVENTEEKPRLLYSVDIWDAYLEGIFILRTEPAFTDCFHIPIDNVQSYKFKKDIPAEDELVIKFFAIGTTPGNYTSYLDVSIDNLVNFVTHPIFTIVED